MCGSLDIGNVGGDAYQEGKASYRLGNALEELGDSDAAISVSPFYCSDSIMTTNSYTVPQAILGTLQVPQ